MLNKNMWQHCETALGQGLFDNDMWIMSILFAFRAANEQVTLQWLTPAVAKQQDMLPALNLMLQSVHSWPCFCISFRSLRTQIWF
jgi:hypothetical protein